jgi:hypothetical protein
MAAFKKAAVKKMRQRDGVVVMTGALAIVAARSHNAASSLPDQ